MNLTFLGTGSAFATEYFQSNALLELNGKRLLIDAGGTIHLALKAAGIGIQSIDSVYVSHLHTDHWGGAEYLAYGSYFNPAFLIGGTRRKLKLFAHPNVRTGLHGNLTGTVLADRKAQLSDFFDVQHHHCHSFEWQGVTFKLIKADHCDDNGQSMPCYGLAWELDSTSGRKSIWFSGDTTLKSDHPLLKSDVVFHDCETAFKTGVHAHYTELATLPSEIKKRMTLYHYNDGNRPNAQSDGFSGWAEQGATINL